MKEVIYRIFVLSLMYVFFGFIYNIFFPKSFWIFSLIFLIFSIVVVWSPNKELRALDIKKREIDERRSQLEAEMMQLQAEMEATEKAELAAKAEHQIEIDKTKLLLPTYKSEYKNALQATDKILAYELGMRYYSAARFAKEYSGSENEIAQRVKNEIDIYSK